MSAARYQVPPTVTVLQGMKSRLTGAKKGHGVLKKKADALTMKFRQILKKIVDTKEQMGLEMQTASFALTEAVYVAGEQVKYTIQESVDARTSAKVRVKAGVDNIAGVKIPNFKRTDEEDDHF